MKTIQFLLLLSSIFLYLFNLTFTVTKLQCAAYTAESDEDKIALVAFRGLISPEDLGALSSWNIYSHFCNWKGVTCDLDQRVVELDLSSHGLIGTISPSIGDLSLLRKLNLEDNYLHGQIPQEVGRLLSLQIFAVGNNSLSGPLPLSLSSCLELVNISMSRNMFTGRIPEEYGNFPNLASLSLHANYLVGGIPVSFGNLSSITHLLIGDNILIGKIPVSLGKLTRISTLGLGPNMLSGMIPPSFYNITSLQFISLASNQLEGSLAPDLGLKFPRLRFFFIGMNQFSGPIPISLFTNASELVVLSMSENRFSGGVPLEVGRLGKLEKFELALNSLGSGGKDDLEFLSSLNNCTSLQILDVQGNNLGGKLPGSITNLSNTLTVLDLGHNQIFGSIPVDIEKLSHLTELSIPVNMLSGTIPMSIGMLQHLKKLILDGNNLSNQIPYSIKNISSLSILVLSNNRFIGNLDLTFDNCHSLKILYLNHNLLHGKFPKYLFEMSKQLSEVSFAHNNFTGSLPLEIGILDNLRSFDVGENRISGEIPSTLGNCSVLEKLFLEGNVFHGSIPSSFSLLRGIKLVDLSRNNLSGKVLKDLENLPSLLKLNLSFNYFEGEVPRKGVFQNASGFSIVGNLKLCGGITELKLPNCSRSSNRKNIPVRLKVTLWVLPFSFLIIASILFVSYSNRKPSPKPIVDVFRSSTPIVKVFRNGLQRVSYKELYDATSGFSSETLIGMGGYGSVYKGVLRENESSIAVKVLNLMERGALKSFMVECKILKEIRHRNLLKMLTVCSSIDFNGNDFRALIFELMPNGSVESWLHPSSTSNRQQPYRNLDFLQRLNIATDIASALDYLHNHQKTPIIHCDLKPSNVLLNKDMVACVADFGLAKFSRINTINQSRTETNSIAVRGTIGYIPPECSMGAKVHTKWDAYSYGILILELFTGKRPTDAMFVNGLNIRSFCKDNLAERAMSILDSRLCIGEFIDENEPRRFTVKMNKCLISILEIGLACSSELVVERMEIGEALIKMQNIRKRVLLQGTAYNKM